MKKALLSIVCIVLFVYSGVYDFRVYAQERYRIVLTTEGFSPVKMTVPAGADVVFETNGERYFWPASDDHPTHEVYAEFDPKKPIAPDATWSFRFDKAGEWKFHDHISPFYTGVITVIDEETQRANAHNKMRIILFAEKIYEYLKSFITQNILFVSTEKCASLIDDRGERLRCWQKVLLPMLRKKGVEPTLAFVQKQQSHDMQFAADCHIYMHRLGEEAYWQFLKDNNIIASDAFGMCEMGYFHGFMQEFISHGQHIVQAKQYCDQITAKMPRTKEAPEILWQCYHGIGHGLVYMYAPIYWGDEQKIIQLSIEGCNAIVTMTKECVNGVYGGLAAMHWGLHGFVLTMPEEDPFRICHGQPVEYRLGCYNMYVPVVHSVFRSDFQKTAASVMNIHDPIIRRVAMEHLGSIPVYTLTSDEQGFTWMIAQCRALPGDNHQWCLRGFAGTIVRVGVQPDATIRAQGFCGHTALTKAEQTWCFDSIVYQVVLFMPLDEAKSYCKRVGKEHDVPLECESLERP